MTADAYSGTPHSNGPDPVPLTDITPPPSSLCPVCQNVEADAKQYLRDGVDEVAYVCDTGHSWIVRWTAVA